MEAHGSARQASLQCGGDDRPVRSFAGYQQSVWGDYFIENHPLPSKLQNSEACIKKRIGELVVEVKNLLKISNDHLQEIELIDALQHLGVAYHFEEEIDEKLSQISNAHINDDDLYVVALHFRLLRQHGYHIPASVFNKFKEDEGSFKATLKNDVKGLLSLYEAAYLSTTKEYILDEALNFAKVHLKSIESQIRSPFVAQVLHSLRIPLHRRMRRLDVKNYISIYEQDERQINVVLELAKLDFHMLQSIHREEVRSISKYDLMAEGSLPP